MRSTKSFAPVGLGAVWAVWLLAAQRTIASPVENATENTSLATEEPAAIPPRGPNRYKALGVGHGGATLESRALHDVFEDQGLLGAIIDTQHDELATVPLQELGHEAVFGKRQTVQKCRITSDCSVSNMAADTHPYCNPAKECTYRELLCFVVTRGN